MTSARWDAEESRWHLVTSTGDEYVAQFLVSGIGALHIDAVLGRASGQEHVFARQVSQRGGEVYCELAGDRVKMGGDAVLYLKGEIYVSEQASAAA